MVKDYLSINLLDNKGVKSSEVFLKWAVYVGRLLIILTESAALIVFISRFSIDRQLIDLNDDIKNRQAIVEYFQNSEAAFRKAQLKLSVGKANISSSSAVFNIFEYVLQQNKTDVIIKNLNVSPQSMTVTAASNTPDNLSAFTKTLRQMPETASLSIDKVETKPTNTFIAITITVQLKKKIL